MEGTGSHSGHVIAADAGWPALRLEHLAPGLPWLHRGFYLMGLPAGGVDAAKDSWKNLKAFELDIHFLMLAVAIGADLHRCVGRGSAVVVLVHCRRRDGGICPRLHAARGQRAAQTGRRSDATLVLPGGGEREIDVAELGIGDHVRVKPGEAFPADGTVIHGKSASDESALTGESVPVSKGDGDTVFSGTLNLWGAVDFIVERLPAESKLQKIIRLIQTARQLKAPSERFTDKFGTGYTYLVIGGSLAMFLIWRLGFHPAGTSKTRRRRARPLSRDDAHGRPGFSSRARWCCRFPRRFCKPPLRGAHRHGVLFRGGAAIEKLADVTVVALDKTGTLTTGELAVVGCESYPAAAMAR